MGSVLVSPALGSRPRLYARQCHRRRKEAQIGCFSDAPDFDWPDLTHLRPGRFERWIPVSVLKGPSWRLLSEKNGFEQMLSLDDIVCSLTHSKDNKLLGV